MDQYLSQKVFGSLPEIAVGAAECEHYAEIVEEALAKLKKCLEEGAEDWQVLQRKHETDPLISIKTPTAEEDPIEHGVYARAEHQFSECSLADVQRVFRAMETTDLLRFHMSETDPMFVDGMVGAAMTLPRSGGLDAPAALCYIATSKAAPFWDRDYVFVRALVTERHPSTGRQALYVVEVSVDRYEFPPLEKYKRVRAQIPLRGYMFTPVSNDPNEGLHVSYVVQQKDSVSVPLNIQRKWAIQRAAAIARICKHLQLVQNLYSELKMPINTTGIRVKPGESYLLKVTRAGSFGALSVFSRHDLDVFINDICHKIKAGELATLSVPGDVSVAKIRICNDALLTVKTVYMKLDQLVPVGASNNSPRGSVRMPSGRAGLAKLFTNAQLGNAIRRQRRVLSPLRIVILGVGTLLIGIAMPHMFGKINTPELAVAAFPFHVCLWVLLIASSLFYVHRKPWAQCVRVAMQSGVALASGSTVAFTAFLQSSPNERALNTTVLIGGLTLCAAIGFYEHIMNSRVDDQILETPLWTNRPTRALARERADTTPYGLPTPSCSFDRVENLSKDSAPSSQTQLTELIDPQDYQRHRRFSGDTASSGMDARSIDVHPSATPHALSPRTRSLPTMSKFVFDPVPRAEPNPAVAALKETPSNHASRRTSAVSDYSDAESVQSNSQLGEMPSDLPAAIVRDLQTTVVKHTHATQPKAKWSRQGFKLKKIPKKVRVVLTASTLSIYNSELSADKDDEAVCYVRLAVPGLLVGVGRDNSAVLHLHGEAADTSTPKSENDKRKRSGRQSLIALTPRTSLGSMQSRSFSVHGGLRNVADSDQPAQARIQSPKFVSHQSLELRMSSSDEVFDWISTITRLQLTHANLQSILMEGLDIAGRGKSRMRSYSADDDI